MDSIFVIEKHLCIDCSNCENVCQERYGNPRIRRGASERHIGVEVPQVCRHCKTPVCATKCPRQAIGVVGGIVVINDRCIGCGNCARLCPYESIVLYPMNSEETKGEAETRRPRRRAEKCTLCRGFPNQACVEECPTGALKRVNIGKYEAPPMRARRTIFALALMVTPVVLFFTLGVAFKLYDKPSERTPHILSMVGTLLFVVALLYTVRKRTKHLPFGRLRTWLWGHIILSAAGFVLIIFHTSGTVGLNEPTAALLLLIILVVTGVFYRFIYPQRPKPAVLADLSRQKLNDMIEGLEEIAPLEEALRGAPAEFMGDAGRNVPPEQREAETQGTHVRTAVRRTSAKALAEDRAYRLFEVSRLSVDVEYLAHWEMLLRKFDYISYMTCTLHKWIALTFITLLVLHVILVFASGLVKIF